MPSDFRRNLRMTERESDENLGFLHIGQVCLKICESKIKRKERHKEDFYVT